jgi:serine phosphatase RsbU (regulator of sigma subunit)/anti-sigma regulatory factor (Ser/Thr protein kinase)
VVDLAPPSASAVSAPVRCAELATEFDWSESEFGPQSQWVPAVEVIVRTLLEATVAMAYCHGSSHAMVYNDRFADVLGPKHPNAWGQGAASVLQEIWSHPGLVSVLDEVFADGQSVHDDGDTLGLSRRQHAGHGDAHFVGSYSAVRDVDGSILGVLLVAVEITSAAHGIEAVVDLVTALASAVSVDEVATTALQHAVRTLGAETAMICLGAGDESGWRVAAWRETEPWDHAAARLPLIWSNLRADAGSPQVAVAESGQRHVSETGLEVILPIRGTEVAGSMGYLGMQHHVLESRMVVLEACALLVADAMARALQHETRRGAAELLHRTLLPQALPSVPGVILAGRYQPVSTATAAGGDFYDCFTLPNGRLAFTVGDVMGRGVAAVRVMGQVRAGLRGAALSSSDPNAVFAALDKLVAGLDVSRPAVVVDGQSSPYVRASGFGGELFVTALFGILDPATGELLLASAGHPPPAVAHRRTEQDGSGGRMTVLAPVDPGPPLGIPGNRPVLRIVLDQGDALVAFTDGLLEPRRGSLSQGLDRLLRTVSTMAATEPRRICRHLLGELLGTDGLENDCALLVLLRDSRLHQVASLTVPPQAGAVRGARLWVRDQLDAWGLSGEIKAAAAMGVSELVTNVVLHAGTPAMVSLELDGRLLVTVDDTGQWGEPKWQSSESGAASRGRGLALVEAISDNMGRELGVHGSTVWFEIELDRPVSEPLRDP